MTSFGHFLPFAALNSREESGRSIARGAEVCIAACYTRPRLRKCSLAFVETHRTDKSNSNKMDNAMISNSLKAQGKGVTHPALTEVSLRNSCTRMFAHFASFCVDVKADRF
jgi:hypothetical protein